MAQSINASVIECVNQSLHRRGYDPPYDRTQVMGGPHYNYRFETIIALHCQVKKCLKAKGLAYGYPVSNEYFQKSLEMTLRQVYASITSKTGTSVHPDILVTVQASLSDSTLAADSIVPVID